MPAPVLARRLTTPFRSKLLAEYAVNGFFGRITTSRATVSPMYADASGDLVQYAANNVALVNGDSVACWPTFTNLLSRSEEFDQIGPPWQNFRVTISANAVSAPDGESTADKIVENTDTNTHVFRQAATISDDADATASGYFKAAERTRVKLSVLDKSNVAVGAIFDLSGGSVVSTDAGATSQIEALSNGWYRCSVTVNVGTGVTTPAWDVRLVESGTTTSYEGDGSSGIYGWGAQLTQSSYVLPYVPTTSSSVAVDASEPKGVFPIGLDNDLVIKVRWTPFRASQSFPSVFEVRADANNQLYLYDNSGTMTFGKKVSGTNYDATKSLSYVADTEYEFTGRISSVNGVDFWINDVKGSGNSNTSDITPDSVLHLGRNGLTSGKSYASIRDFRIHKVAPNITDAEVLALP